MLGSQCAPLPLCFEWINDLEVLSWHLDDAPEDDIPREQILLNMGVDEEGNKLK